MTDIKYVAGAITTLLSSELDALADNAGSALGTEYNNASNLNLFGDFQLDVTFAAGPTAGTGINLYLVPATDGTNYNDGATTARPVIFLRGTWPLRNVATQQRLTISGVQLPPLKFKIFVVNNSTGRAFPATGTTVKMVPYSYRSS